MGSQINCALEFYIDTRSAYLKNRLNPKLNSLSRQKRTKRNSIRFYSTNYNLTHELCEILGCNFEIHKCIFESCPRSSLTQFRSVSVAGESPCTSLSSNQAIYLSIRLSVYVYVSMYKRESGPCSRRIHDANASTRKTLVECKWLHQRSGR